MITPSIGRIVHYRGADYDGFSGERSAIIVRTWGTTPESSVNLQVFLDGGNDNPAQNAGPVYWATSRPQGTGAGQWHDYADCQEGK